MILVLGDILLDKFLLNKYEKQSPEAKIPIVKPIKTITRLGGAANLINNINSLNRNCFLISRIGHETSDRELITLLNKRKIKYKLFYQKNFSVGKKSRLYIDKKQIFRIDDEKIINLSRIIEYKIINFIKKNISKYSMLVISDYNKGVINSNIFKKITNIFLKQGKLVITNPKKNKISFYNGSNIIIPNEKEFNKFFNSKTSLKNKVKIFFSSKFLEHLIITRGKKSLIHFTRKNKFFYNVNKVKTFDVTGASDTFVALLSINLFIKNKIEKSIKISIEGATKVVQKKYTSTISKREYSKIEKSL